MHVHRIKAHFIRAPLIYPPPIVHAPGVLNALSALHRKYEFDAFHLHSRWFPDFARCGRYAHSVKRKFFITLHNARPFGISALISLLGGLYDMLYGRRILAEADAIIAVSRWVKKDICQYGLDPSRIFPIHNGVDTARFKPMSRQKREEVRQRYADGFDHLLLFTGRIIEQKGLDYLIEAMPRILAAHPSTKLLIVGKGKLLPHLKKKVSRMALNDWVDFLGFVPESILPSLYAACDVYILPSLWEVLPISLLEALSSGCALVASDAGGNPEIVRHGVNGYVFRKRDVGALARYVIRLLSEPQLRKRMAAQSRRIALKHFDWDIITHQTLSFYQRVID